jgi:TonB family protein
VLIFCIFLATIVVSLAVILPFIGKPHADNVLNGTSNYAQLKMENLKPPEDQIYVPPSPPPPRSVHVDEIVKYVPPEVVDTITPLDKSTLSTDELLSQTTNDKVDDSGTGIGDDLMSGQEGTASDEPFFLVEVMPSFKGGGLEKFRDWIQKTTNYPQSAIDRKLKGKVILTFIVEKDGTVSNVTVVQGVDPQLDDAAVKAISKSPRWTPGLQRGEPVRVRYSIPLNFMF